jgi:hypothetical protein
VNRVLLSNQISPQTVAGVGIAVHFSGLHIGVVYRVTENAAIKLLHLAWHHRLRSDNLSSAYKCWIRPAIADDRALAIAAYCRRIWKQNERNQVPYGFSHPNRFFDTSGNVIKGPAKIGLTCASFVLAVYKGAGVLLGSLDTWPSATSEDIERQRELLSKMSEDDSVDKEHLAAVQAELGNTRYHPLDVAGAGTADPLPSSYQHASRIGRDIQTLITAS